MGVSSSDTRKPYAGSSRGLVIAIDVGTTFSGVSYSILEPQQIPKIHGVTRFPGQEHVAGNSKIPSIMYYDKYGIMRAAGAEADTSAVLSQAEEEGWTKTELFKLRLRPRSMTFSMNGMRLSPLPYRKTAVDVFGDFLRYMFECTRDFIIDTHANGARLWSSVEEDIQFVCSHPNGWQGFQQSQMRHSAIYGGLIPDTNEGKARVRFVTEGEASLHACVLNGLAAAVLSDPKKAGFAIIDAGGGTLDVSSYAIKSTSPLVIEEIAPPDCVFAGSVFVSRRAREFLAEKLKNSKYGNPDVLDFIAKKFDESTKRLFRSITDSQYIPFGSPFDKDSSVGIRSGQLKLTGVEVAALFEPSVEAAVTAIKAQIDASNGFVKSVWLVGGFAASPWLFHQLQERLKGIATVSRPDANTSKAVADGAIGFYCDHFVHARMSKFYYGVEYLRAFDENNAEHVERKNRLCELPSGPKLLPDAFDCILARNIKVKESNVFTRKYVTELISLNTLSEFQVEIWCYRGAADAIPKWILRQSPDFSTLCAVKADLSPLTGSAQPKIGTGGSTYWSIVFSIEIHFGLTEFTARIKWVDNGKTKYGPATIVYNESGYRADEMEQDVIANDDTTTSHSERRRHRRDRDVESSRTRSSQTSSSARDTLKTDDMVPEVHVLETPASNAATLNESREHGQDIRREKSRDRGRRTDKLRADVVSVTPGRPPSPSELARSLAAIYAEQEKERQKRGTEPGSDRAREAELPSVTPRGELLKRIDSKSSTNFSSTVDNNSSIRAASISTVKQSAVQRTPSARPRTPLSSKAGHAAVAPEPINTDITLPAVDGRLLTAVEGTTSALFAESLAASNVEAAMMEIPSPSGSTFGDLVGLSRAHTPRASPKSFRSTNLPGTPKQSSPLVPAVETPTGVPLPMSPASSRLSSKLSTPQPAVAELPAGRSSKLSTPQPPVVELAGATALSSSPLPPPPARLLSSPLTKTATSLPVNKSRPTSTKNSPRVSLKNLTSPKEEESMLHSPSQLPSTPAPRPASIISTPLIADRSLTPRPTVPAELSAEPLSNSNPLTPKPDDEKKLLTPKPSLEEKLLTPKPLASAALSSTPKTQSAKIEEPLVNTVSEKLSSTPKVNPNAVLPEDTSVTPKAAAGKLKALTPKPNSEKLLTPKPSASATLSSTPKPDSATTEEVTEKSLSNLDVPVPPEVKSSTPKSAAGKLKASTPKPNSEKLLTPKSSALTTLPSTPKPDSVKIEEVVAAEKSSSNLDVPAEVVSSLTPKSAAGKLKASTPKSSSEKLSTPKPSALATLPSTPKPDSVKIEEVVAAEKSSSNLDVPAEVVSSLTPKSAAGKLKASTPKSSSEKLSTPKSSASATLTSTPKPDSVEIEEVVAAEKSSSNLDVPAEVVKSSAAGKLKASTPKSSSEKLSTPKPPASVALPSTPKPDSAKIEEVVAEKPSVLEVKSLTPASAAVLVPLPSTPAIASLTEISTETPSPPVEAAGAATEPASPAEETVGEESSGPKGKKARKRAANKLAKSKPRSGSLVNVDGPVSLASDFESCSDLTNDDLWSNAVENEIVLSEGWAKIIKDLQEIEDETKKKQIKAARQPVEV